MKHEQIGNYIHKQAHSAYTSKKTWKKCTKIKNLIVKWIKNMMENDKQFEEIFRYEAKKAEEK